MANEDQKNEEIVRLLAIWLKRGMAQATLIEELNSAGFGQKRIAELLGTTPNTVNVTLNKLKKAKAKKK